MSLINLSGFLFSKFPKSVDAEVLPARKTSAYKGCLHKECVEIASLGRISPCSLVSQRESTFQRNSVETA